MAKQVRIHICAKQMLQEGETDGQELITLGTFYDRDGVYYILYKESEISGMDGVTTSLKIKGDHVVLNRMGTVKLKQEFQPGVLHRSVYATMVGNFRLGILAKRVESNLTAQGGRISLDYDLFVDDNFISHNNLTLIIKEEPPR